VTLPAVLFGVAAAAIALLRWVRVAQREHYLAGSGVTAAWRWIRVRPPNGLLAALAAAGIGGALGAEIAGHSGVAIVASCFLAAITAVFPWPMRVLGRPRLRFTRRATTLLGLGGDRGLRSGSAGIGDERRGRDGSCRVRDPRDRGWRSRVGVAVRAHGTGTASP